MKATLILIALAALPALSPANLRSEIEAANKPIAAALKARNMDAFARATRGVMTPDFKYSDDGGQPMDYKGMLAGMKMGIGMYQKITKAKAEIVSLTETANTGTAVERHTMEGLTGGPDKKTHKMVFVGTSQETFRKVKGKWMMASMVMKTDKMLMDGKPMSMGR